MYYNKLQKKNCSNHYFVNYFLPHFAILRFYVCAHIRVDKYKLNHNYHDSQHSVIVYNISNTLIFKNNLNNY